MPHSYLPRGLTDAGDSAQAVTYFGGQADGVRERVMPGEEGLDVVSN